jgi:hypothetical protein
VVYDRLAEAEPGSSVTQQELMDLMGTDKKNLMYAAVSRAASELRKHNLRDIASERGRGYRILYAREHTTKAHVHKNRAERQIRLANETIAATDVAELTASERDLWTRVRTGMWLLYEAVSSHEVTLAKHEALLNSLQARIDKLTDSES